MTTDPDGHSTTDTYDDDNRLISVTDPDGDSTDYGYNKDGDQTSVTDSDGNTTTEVYDLDDRLISSTSPIETTSYTYDGDDNMLSQITPDGTNAWTYDADGRKTSETLTGDARTFTYNEDGDMLTAGNVEGSYTFTYDNDNRVIGVSEPFGVSLTYGLDADGDQTTVTDSFGGSETSTYDADGEVLSRSYSGESQALTMNFTYTALGQVATETDIGSSGTIATTSTTYDADSDITGVTTTNSGGTINAFSYVYDPAGNETSETDNGVTTTYTYDAAGQLTGANSTTYSYDADGNDDNSGDSDGTDNELLSDGTYNYTYDSAGNEVSKTNIATGDVWTYYYNSQNAMTQALETTSPGTGGVMEQDIFYRYDAFGNMIQKEVVTGGMSGTDTITDYAVDGWNPALAGATGNSKFNTWAVLNVSGSSTSLQTRNLFGDQVHEIIARIDQAGASDSAGVYWDLTDKLGSVRTVLNGGGTVVDTINYDAYGNTTSETNVADQGMYGWTGQEKDLETGLQYNNARWYDSSTGRWISQDPMGFDAGDSNLYRYVNNAPTDDTDPSGELPRIPWYANPGMSGGAWGEYPDQEQANSVRISYYPQTLGPPQPPSAAGPLEKSVTASPTPDKAYDLADLIKAPYDTQWKINGKKNGFIVQHIIRESVINGKTTKTDEYWEAWEVINGEVFNGYAKDKAKFVGIPPGRDLFTINIPSLRTLTNKNDKIIVRGFAKFVERKIDWTYDVMEAGLPSTRNRPGWWNDTDTIQKELIGSRAFGKQDFTKDSFLFTWK